MTESTDKLNTVDKFMKEYLKDKSEVNGIENNEELIVNFNLTYPEGNTESFVCGQESGVFTCEVKEEVKENNQDYYEENNMCCCDKSDGEIEVVSTLNSIDGKRIKGIVVKLYKINGLCPVEVDAKVTDCEGTVRFCDLNNGNYRVVQLIDYKYFNKPKYINWNEVVIDECTKYAKIHVINTIRVCNN